MENAFVRRLTVLKDLLRCALKDLLRGALSIYHSRFRSPFIQTVNGNTVR